MAYIKDIIMAVNNKKKINSSIKVIKKRSDTEKVKSFQISCESQSEMMKALWK